KAGHGLPGGRLRAPARGEEQHPPEAEVAHLGAELIEGAVTEHDAPGRLGVGERAHGGIVPFRSLASLSGAGFQVSLGHLAGAEMFSPPLMMTSFSRSTMVT